MALPKEPRQKMINIMYLVLTALLALNVSAEILNAFKVVDNSLIVSNQLLSKSTSDIYTNLDSMRLDPKTKDKADIWKPKADEVKKLADEASSMIDKLKEELKKEADIQPDGSFKEDNIDAATRLFDTKGQGKVLYEKLLNFKTKLLAIDSSMTNDIGTKIPLNLDVPKTASGNLSTGDKIKDWTTSYFHMTPTVAALTMLSKFQNDIKNSENIAATHCINQVGAVKLIFNKFDALIGTSSTYLMPGEEMSVTAGLGAYSTGAKPTVTIEGRTVPLDEKGIAQYKFNVGGTGSSSVNVNVTYIDPNSGKTETVSKKIDYTVGAPSGVAVSPDKMNVLYVGVDNPLTITAGAGSEKVSAQFSGGSITKLGGNKYVAKPSQGISGEHYVTVLVEGKAVGKIGFRVKQLPSPSAYVGSLKQGSVPSANFKAMGGVIAKLEDSEFDAPFEVVSYSVGAKSDDIPDYMPISNSGSRWTGSAASLISRLKPGALVIISEIVVRDMGGKTRTLNGSLTYSLK